MPHADGKTVEPCLRAAWMFGAHPHPNHPAKNMRQSRYARNSLQLPRRFDRTGVLENVFETSVSVDLDELSYAGRKLAPRLHTGQTPLGQPPLAQRSGQNISRGDRILNREVDAHATRRRHRVRRVSDTQETRRVPLPQTVDLYRPQFDLIPISQVLNA